MDTKPIFEDADDLANTRIVDHLLIRDPKSGIVIVNQRGSVVSPLFVENPRNEDDANPTD
jgi:hypothetical protein